MVLDVLDKDNNVQEILGYENTDLDIDVRECVEWIKGLKRKWFPEMDMKISKEALCYFARKLNDSKSSSPSGRHYGQYKVLSEDEEIWLLM